MQDMEAYFIQTIRELNDAQAGLREKVSLMEDYLIIRDGTRNEQSYGKTKLTKSLSSSR